MKVRFYEIGEVKDEELKFAVINSKFDEKWIFVRHKHRETWEIPGGHREPGESVDETAKRELFEETGAKTYTILPVCDYSVTKKDVASYGRLYLSYVNELDKLPNLEIGEIRLCEDIPSSLTYPEIQPFLHEKVKHITDKVDYSSENF